jgi:Proteasome assembly chaperone 4
MNLTIIPTFCITLDGRRRMGNFVVAMPKRAYAGAFGNDSTSSSSKLIGSGSVHNDLVAIHMASRLSEKLQMSIFCSCNLDEGRPEAALGGETEIYLLQSRAAALAEKEIGQILQRPENIFSP